MGVSENSGTPKSSILIGFSILNHPFWGTVPLFLETPIYLFFSSCPRPSRLNFVDGTGISFFAPFWCTESPFREGRGEEVDCPICFQPCHLTRQSSQLSSVLELSANFVEGSAADPRWSSRAIIMFTRLCLKLKCWSAGYHFIRFEKLNSERFES